MNKIIAQKIRRLRQNRDLSQDNMADELGITKGAYSKLERGVTAISVDRLDQISKVLNVGIGLFFQDSSYVGMAEEHLPQYGFATKSDIEELARMITAFREELNSIRKELNADAKKAQPAKKAAKK